MITAAKASTHCVKRLVLEKVGSLRCTAGAVGHTYALIFFRGRMFLRCSTCGAETEGFQIYTPLRGGR